MNKCKNCGSEFEGQTCPECGTIAENMFFCPNCGSKLEGNVKFCTHCGQKLWELQPMQVKQEQQRSSVQSITLTFDFHKLADILPMIIFGLWAALLWAFYSAKVIKGDGVFIESINLYQLLQSEIISDEARNLARLFIVFGILSDIFALAYMVVQIVGSRLVKQVFNDCAIVFPSIIILGSVITLMECNQFTQDVEFLRGNMPVVTIVCTGVFVLLLVLAIIINRFCGTNKLTGNIDAQRKKAAALEDVSPDEIRKIGRLVRFQYVLMCLFFVIVLVILVLTLAMIILH